MWKKNSFKNILLKEYFVTNSHFFGKKAKIQNEKKSPQYGVTLK
jgi:hypothetical protein